MKPSCNVVLALCAALVCVPSLARETVTLAVLDDRALADGATPEGKAYLKEFFTNPWRLALDDADEHCRANWERSELLEEWVIALNIGGNGYPTDVLVSPDNDALRCMADRLKATGFIKPPHDDFAIYLRFKHTEPGTERRPSLVPASGAASNSADSPRVEFVEEKGRPCLRPVVHGEGAVLADYREAELRWLAAKYPGNPPPRAKTELSLSGTSGRTQRETFYLDGVVGPAASVCFDLGVAFDPAKTAAPSAAPDAYRHVVSVGCADPDGRTIAYVWHTDALPKNEGVRVFKVLAGPEIEECLSEIARTRSGLYERLANLGPKSADEVRTATMNEVAELWAEHGVYDAVREVAETGASGPKVEALLHRCGDLRGARQ